MLLKVTLPMTPMRSRTYNHAKGGENENVCLDMNRDWCHLTVAMILSYNRFGCFYIDMRGCGRKKKGKALQSHRVCEFPKRGQSILHFCYLHQCK